MSLDVIMLLHIVANVICWIRWSLASSRQPVIFWILAGFIMGWIPMWPSNMAMNWFLTILMAFIEVLWFLWNMRAAEDACLDKTRRFYVADELKRYRPDSE